mgnify:CR=1 FL=1
MQQFEYKGRYDEVKEGVHPYNAGVVGTIKPERNADDLRCEMEKLRVDFAYQTNKLKSENEKLKECIVRMAMGKYGVLNDD